MSSMIKDIQSIINNNVSEFIRILSDRYELDINELHNTWGDISLGKDNKKSNDVKTNQKPNKKQIEKEEEEKEEEKEEDKEYDEEESIDIRENSSSKVCPYKFSKGVRQGEICGIKANKGTHCSKHKKYEKDVPTKSKNTRTTAKPVSKPAVKQIAKPDSKPDSKPEAKPDSKPVSNSVSKPDVKNNTAPITKTYAKPIRVSETAENIPDYLKARTGDLKSLMNTNILEFVKYKRAPFMYNSVTGLILKSNNKDDATIVAKVVDNILLPLQESEIKLCESRNFKYDTKFYFDEIYDEEISEKVLESTSLPESILQLFKIIKNQLSEDSCNEKTETVKQVEEEAHEEEDEDEVKEEEKCPKLSHISALEAIEKIKESIIESSDSDDEIITRKEEKKTFTKTNSKTSSKKDITSDSDDDDIYTRKQRKNTITKTSSKNSSKKYITSDSDSDDEIITRKDKKKTSSKNSSKKYITSDSDSDDEIITRKDKKKTITKKSSKTSSKKDIASDSDSADEIITRKEEKQDTPAYIRLSQRSYSSLSSDLDEYLYTDSDESETENKLPNRNIDKSKYISATEYIRKNSVNDSEDELEEELELEEDEE